MHTTAASRRIAAQPSVVCRAVLRRPAPRQNKQRVPEGERRVRVRDSWTAASIASLRLSSSVFRELSAHCGVPRGALGEAVPPRARMKYTEFDGRKNSNVPLTYDHESSERSLSSVLDGVLSCPVHSVPRSVIHGFRGPRCDFGGFSKVHLGTSRPLSLVFAPSDS